MFVKAHLALITLLLKLCVESRILYDVDPNQLRFVNVTTARTLSIRPVGASFGFYESVAGLFVSSLDTLSIYFISGLTQTSTSGCISETCSVTLVAGTGDFGSLDGGFSDSTTLAKANFAIPCRILYLNESNMLLVLDRGTGFIRTLDFAKKSVTTMRTNGPASSKFALNYEILFSSQHPELDITYYGNYLYLSDSVSVYNLTGKSGTLDDIQYYPVISTYDTIAMWQSTYGYDYTASIKIFITSITIDPKRNLLYVALCYTRNAIIVMPINLSEMSEISLVVGDNIYWNKIALYYPLPINGYIGTDPGNATVTFPMDMHYDPVDDVLYFLEALSTTTFGSITTYLGSLGLRRIQMRTKMVDYYAGNIGSYRAYFGRTNGYVDAVAQKAKFGFPMTILFAGATLSIGGGPRILITDFSNYAIREVFEWSNSVAPTTLPTASPSTPTTSPTRHPTPTLQLTPTPTIRTMTPSYIPTGRPTAIPTTTIIPTSLPTTTTLPTSLPTFTVSAGSNSSASLKITLWDLFGDGWSGASLVIQQQQQQQQQNTIKTSNLLNNNSSSNTTTTTTSYAPTCNTNPLQFEVYATADTSSGGWYNFSIQSTASTRNLWEIYWMVEIVGKKEVYQGIYNSKMSFYFNPSDNDNDNDYGFHLSKPSSTLATYFNLTTSCMSTTTTTTTSQMNDTTTVPILPGLYSGINNGGDGVTPISSSSSSSTTGNTNNNNDNKIITTQPVVDAGSNPNTNNNIAANNNNNNNKENSNNNKENKNNKDSTSSSSSSSSSKSSSNTNNKNSNSNSNNKSNNNKDGKRRMDSTLPTYNHTNNNNQSFETYGNDDDTVTSNNNGNSPPQNSIHTTMVKKRVVRIAPKMPKSSTVEYTPQGALLLSLYSVDSVPWIASSSDWLGAMFFISDSTREVLLATGSLCDRNVSHCVISIALPDGQYFLRVTGWNQLARQSQMTWTFCGVTSEILNELSFVTVNGACQAGVLRSVAAVCLDTLRTSVIYEGRTVINQVKATALQSEEMSILESSIAASLQLRNSLQVTILSSCLTEHNVYCEYNEFERNRLLGAIEEEEEEEEEKLLVDSYHLFPSAESPVHSSFGRLLSSWVTWSTAYDPWSPHHHHHRLLSLSRSTSSLQSFDIRFTVHMIAEDYEIDGTHLLDVYAFANRTSQTFQRTVRQGHMQSEIRSLAGMSMSTALIFAEASTAKPLVLTAITYTMTPMPTVAPTSLPTLPLSKADTTFSTENIFSQNNAILVQESIIILSPIILLLLIWYSIFVIKKSYHHHQIHKPPKGGNPNDDPNNIINTRRRSQLLDLMSSSFHIKLDGSTGSATTISALKPTSQSLDYSNSSSYSSSSSTSSEYLSCKSTNSSANVLSSSSHDESQPTSNRSGSYIVHLYKNNNNINSSSSNSSNIGIRNHDDLYLDENENDDDDDEEEEEDESEYPYLSHLYPSQPIPPSLLPRPPHARRALQLSELQSYRSSSSSSSFTSSQSAAAASSSSTSSSSSSTSSSSTATSTSTSKHPPPSSLQQQPPPPLTTQSTDPPHLPLPLPPLPHNITSTTTSSTTQSLNPIPHKPTNYNNYNSSSSTTSLNRSCRVKPIEQGIDDFYMVSIHYDTSNHLHSKGKAGLLS